MANKTDTKKNKKYLILAIIYNISMLFVFKYADFVIEIFNDVSGASVRKIGLPLPIGISFYTFQALSYVIDVYRGNGKAQKNFWNVALYISFFPQLIAGPIVRYETIEREIENRKESWEEVSKGITKFIIGLSKKVLLANTFGVLVDTYWNYSRLSMGMSWLLAVSYTFQIYFDFSGYSDMAIGLGTIFGFHFEENFRYPYISKSITEFWRRWHISLSQWFRDYVYITLGGNRVSKRRNLWNLFVVWLLTGIWHGANWTFIIWGMLYFVLLIIEKRGLSEKKKSLGIFGHIYTMFFVIIAWVIFRAENLSDALRVLKTMFGMNGNILDNNFLIFLNSYKWYLVLGVLCALPMKEWSGKFREGEHMFRRVLYIVGMNLLLIAPVATIVKGSYNPFIYFNF